MKQAADGSILVTIVSGTSVTGLYAADGSMNIIEAAGRGIYHRCGARRVTTVPGTSVTGLYAADGSWNATNADTDGKRGLQHPCGAFRMDGLFSLLQLSPAAWYDPSDLSTLFQLSNGTVPVTANNDPVGYMGDRSGNVNHLIQATAGARPLYKTSGGLSWLEFDGVDDFLKDLFTLNQPCDRVIAFQQISWAPADTLWDGGVLNSCRIYQDDAGLSPELTTYAGANVALADELIATDQVLTERWNGAGSRFAIDNNNYVTGNPGAANPAGFTLGAHGNDASFSNIRFYGGAIFSSAQTDPNIALLRTYMAAKQGRVL